MNKLIFIVCFSVGFALFVFILDHLPKVLFTLGMGAMIGWLVYRMNKYEHSKSKRAR